MGNLEQNHIGWAVYKLEMGYMVRRRAWPSGRCLEMAPERKPTWMTGQLILIWNGVGGSEAYTCTQEDLLAKDWELA